MRKYVLHPGIVQSRNDGQLHHIGTLQLARLYGVPMSECWTYSKSPRRRLSAELDGLIHLFPRHGEDYAQTIEHEEKLYLISQEGKARRAHAKGQPAGASEGEDPTL